MVQFPVSKYVRYKRATSFFLDWLLRVRGGKRDASKRMRLETLTQVVEELAAEPSTLTPALLKDFPKALAACQCAITLRERVAAFFADAEHRHQHFLGLLRSWLNTLKEVVVGPQHQQQDDGASANLESTKFENYYEALELDEDYFPDAEACVAEASALKSFKVDRQQLLEEAFAEDMRLEVAYLFIELEELAHEVFSAYDKVKTQEYTMVEATVVAKLAMDVASSLIATLQLRYPSLRTGLDFLDAIMEKDPESLSARMEEAYQTTRSNLQTDGVFKFVPGMFLLDFGGVGTTLQAFVRMIPPNLRYSIVVPRGYFGESYDEERTPHYVLPDPSNMNMVMFLRQQLPELYNSLLYTKITTSKTYEPTEDPDWRLSAPFISVMNEFFKSGEVTASTVFVCICWLKSVAALQGDGGLKRNTSWTLKHSADITSRFDVAVAKGAIEAVDKELHDFFTFYSVFMRVSNSHSHLAHTNPILAGLMMLDHHFEYLDLASELVVVTPKFYAFAHLYNTLGAEGFLQKLPFVEEILGIYEKMLFTPSRTAAGHGSYYRTYLLSLSLKATALDEVLCGKRGNVGTDMRKARTVFLLSDVSKIFRLMVKGDNSVLGGLSSTALLTTAANTCSSELFESRVLSRDIVILHDDLSNIFSEMCDVLGKGPTRGGRDENFVVTSVTRALDALQPNGELLMSALPGGNPYPWLDRVSGRRVKEVCKKLAAVIEAKFGVSADNLEQRYCVFSSFPDGGKPATGHPTATGLAGQLQRKAVETPSSNTPGAAAKKKKKRKNKNKKTKKNKGKEHGAPSAPGAAAAGGDDEIAEVSKMLKQLLTAVGVDIEADCNQPGLSTMEELLRQTAAAVFTRLRDPGIPVQFKAVDVQHASALMDNLQGLTAKFSTPAKVSSTSARMRNLIF